MIQQRDLLTSANVFLGSQTARYNVGDPSRLRVKSKSEQLAIEFLFGVHRTVGWEFQCHRVVLAATTVAAAIHHAPHPAQKDPQKHAGNHHITEFQPRQFLAVKVNRSCKNPTNEGSINHQTTLSECQYFAQRLTPSADNEIFSILNHIKGAGTNDTSGKSPRSDRINQFFIKATSLGPVCSKPNCSSHSQQQHDSIATNCHANGHSVKVGQFNSWQDQDDAGHHRSPQQPLTAQDFDW